MQHRLANILAQHPNTFWSITVVAYTLARTQHDPNPDPTLSPNPSGAGMVARFRRVFGRRFSRRKRGCPKTRPANQTVVLHEYTYKVVLHMRPFANYYNNKTSQTTSCC